MRKIYKDQLEIKFQSANWTYFPELAVIDILLEENQQILDLVSNCFKSDYRWGKYGRKGMSVDQILRCAIYKAMKDITYSELEKDLVDSQVCKDFCKMGYGEYYTDSTLQENISKIDSETIAEVFNEIGRIGLELGVDNGVRVRLDTTTVEADVHYPTNSSLLYDVIRKANDYMEGFRKIVSFITFRDYRKQAKANDFKIVNIKGTKKMSQKDKRCPLFKNQLILLKKSYNQMVAALEIDVSSLNLDLLASLIAENFQRQMKELLPYCEQIKEMVERSEIGDEKLENSAKFYSIFEPHTECIVKGSRDIVFGHKISLASGTSNLLFEFELLEGNPSDTTTFKDCLLRIRDNLGFVPQNQVSDGGYASQANHDFARRLGIRNNVFNKIKGSMQNIVSSKQMETRLKKWRSGIEAIISNIKRGLGLTRCLWRGIEHTRCFIKWVGIAFNLKVIAAYILAVG